MYLFVFLAPIIAFKKKSGWSRKHVNIAELGGGGWAGREKSVHICKESPITYTAFKQSVCCVPVTRCGGEPRSCWWKGRGGSATASAVVWCWVVGPQTTEVGREETKNCWTGHCCHWEPRGKCKLVDLHQRSMCGLMWYYTKHLQL